MVRLVGLLSPEAVQCLWSQEWEKPLEEFEAAWKASPNDYNARLGVAVCCMQAGQFEKAARLLAFTQHGEPARGVPEDRPTIAEIIHHCFPEKPAVWLLLAEELHEQGDREQAGTICDEIPPFLGELPKGLQKRWRTLRSQTRTRTRVMHGPSRWKTVLTAVLALALLGAAGWWGSAAPQRARAAGEASLFRGYLAVLHSKHGAIVPSGRQGQPLPSPRAPGRTALPSPAADGSPGPYEHFDAALRQFEWLLKRNPDDKHARFCAWECCGLLLGTLPPNTSEGSLLRKRMADLEGGPGWTRDDRAREQAWFDQRCRALQEGRVEEL